MLPNREHLIQQLITHISKFCSIEPEKSALLESFFEHRVYRKKELLLAEGNRCHEKFFIIKGCVHIFYLKQNGTEQTIDFALSAWQESPLFSDSEKAALKVAEDFTHISVNGVFNESYEKLKSHFNTKEIADIIVCACHINFLNRVGISTKTVPV